MTSFQVIGAGLGRTGTTSLKQALEELGFLPCHHWDETYETEAHINRLWKDVYRKKFGSIDHQDENDLDELLKVIFKGYTATVDCPGYMFYDKFLKWNPEAKVVLSVRDSPEQYEKSVQSTFFWANNEKSWLKRTFWKIMEVFTYPEHLYWIDEYAKKLHGVDPTQPESDLALMYTEWVNKVIETVPPEQLLVYNVKTGWKPLCDFLGVDVPDRPFPRKNNSEEMNAKEIKRSANTAIGRVSKISIAILGIIGAVYIKNRMT